MSFFLATVKKGTRFYHGTRSSDPIVGVKWLPFKPQCWLGFAYGEHRKEMRSLLKNDHEHEQDPLGNGPAHTNISDPVNMEYLHTYTVSKKHFHLL
ncbi:hypothetical protein N7471_001785 [Penicillium samsonianum]|uniref:uncharacterized protein n=1 Tax=Penicillium samsonianum TaxID=1882272 RepID=UPI00254941BD|nr:uncharacterized protein N7471_001785 [Penicillium samsonianum]KAJ6150586.1 hypothetical protein N7471_001785 [Penicillium samsonianum]